MSDEVIFNHVGHCVSDLAVARRFYEEVLGFKLWWSFDVPDDPATTVLRVRGPMKLTAQYLVRDGLVLELLEYGEASARRNRTERHMNEPGLTHLSLSVADLPAALAKVAEYGGTRLVDTETDAVAFVRDPDGQLIELSTMAWRDFLPPAP